MYSKILIITLISKLILCLNPEFKTFLKDIEISKNIIYLLDLTINKEEAKSFINVLSSTNSTDSLSLNIRKCKIDDQAAGIIGRNLRNIRLKELNIVKTEISETGVIQIFQGLKNSKLEKLYMSNIPMNNRIAEELVELLKSTNIIYLTLTQCHINDDFMIKLAKWLKNSEVKLLNLANNGEISDIGINSIVDILKYTKIQLLNFRQCKISNSGAIKLIKSLKSTKVFELYLQPLNMNSNELNEIEKLLKNNKRLRTLNGLKYDSKSIRKNIQLFKAAKNAIDLFLNHRLKFNSEFRYELAAFELFYEDDFLWLNIKERDFITKEIHRNIMKNFLKIVRVINNHLIPDKTNLQCGRINIANLPLEIRQNIYRRILISDVVQELTITKKFINFVCSLFY